ncbi:MAG: M3 family oligoendopeptidase [Candidatus Omnitrophica bacterium]|nr:M3 family oligoendopeptidase [Candidatus Omnitrophota bacterium]
MNPSQTVSLAFDQLTPFQPRQFIPSRIDLTDIENIKTLYQKLIDRKINNEKEFEQWILDRSELNAGLEQAGAILYIRMTCQTDDESRAKAYTRFIEEVSPAVKPLDDQLNKMFLELKNKYALNEDRYAIYTRDIKTQVELFTPKNIELQTQVELLSQEYQKICGAMTVHFNGKDHTMPEMSKYLLEQNRELREKAWRATSERRLQDKDKLEDLFEKMLGIRHQIALNAGFKNFMEYKFRALHRFDYTPEDCKQYHRTIEKTVVPLWSQICQRRKNEMKVSNLRPWDGEVDPLGRAPLKPFEQVNDLIAKCKKIFHLVDPDFGKYFDSMAESGMLDLASRKGKAPGGYQTSLDESRRPFIFMNAVGMDGDINTLLHEGGHAFHTLSCRHDPLVDYRHGPMEFNEVASMAMELLAGEYLDEFYSKEEKQRSRENHLEDIVYVLAWVATIDSFQHWIYENPTHTREQRREMWVNIRRSFSGGVFDWAGLEAAENYLWHRQLHIFEVPFYYIEYGIAQLGALQVWQNAKKNWKKAVQDYKSGLELGGAKPLPEIYAKAGIKFDFSERIISPLMEAVKAELKLS